MMRNLVIILMILLWMAGCAKKIPVPYDRLQEGNHAYLHLTTGESLNGEIQKKKKQGIIILQAGSQTPRSIARPDIVNVSVKPPVYDEARRIIPESEISRHKESKNKWLFTLGGSALSFGITFFITANALHQTENEDNTSTLWATTAAGTALGGILFGIQGNKLDRRNSIEKIKEGRKIAALKEREKNNTKKQKVKDELDKMKSEREKQNEEINKLLKKINQKKKED